MMRQGNGEIQRPRQDGCCGFSCGRTNQESARTKADRQHLVGGSRHVQDDRRQISALALCRSLHRYEGHQGHLDQTIRSEARSDRMVIYRIPLHLFAICL